MIDPLMAERDKAIGNAYFLKKLKSLHIDPKKLQALGLKLTKKQKDELAEAKAAGKKPKKTSDGKTPAAPLLNSKTVVTNLKLKKEQYNLEKKSAEPIQLFGRTCDRTYEQCMIKLYPQFPCYDQIYGYKMVYRCGQNQLHTKQYQELRDQFLKNLFPCEKAWNKCYKVLIDTENPQNIGLDKMEKLVKNPLQYKEKPVKRGFQNMVDVNHSQIKLQKKKDLDRLKKREDKSGSTASVFDLMNSYAGRLKDWIRDFKGAQKNLTLNQTKK